MWRSVDGMPGAEALTAIATTETSGGRWFAGLVDAVLFLAVLAFSAVALLAMALAAPLLLAVSAIAPGGSSRGGWRVAGAT